MQIELKRRCGALGMCLLALAGCSRGADDVVSSRVYDSGHNVSSVAFSPDSRRLAIGYENLAVKTVDAKTGTQVREFKGKFPQEPNRVTSVVFSPDSQFLAAGIAGRFGDAIDVWDASTGKLTQFIPHAAQSLAFADGNTVAGGGAQWKNNDWLVATLFWDVHTGKLKRTLGRSAPGNVRSLALSADGKTLVTANDVTDNKTQMLTMDAVVRSWDVKSGKMLWSAKEPTVLNPCVAHSLRAETVASFGVDFVLLRAARTGKLIRKLRLGRSMFHPTSLAFSPDGSTLAAGTGESVTLWNVRTGALVKMLDNHVGPVTCVAYSPNGNYLASGSEDHTVNVWDARTGKIVSSVGQKYRYIPNPFS